MDKRMPNPKLSPNWERATILSRASNGTAYKINWTGRKRGKNLMVNIQQLKQDRQEANEPKDRSDDDQPLPHAPHGRSDATRTGTLTTGHCTSAGSTITTMPTTLITRRSSIICWTDSVRSRISLILRLDQQNTSTQRALRTTRTLFTRIIQRHSTGSIPSTKKNSTGSIPTTTRTPITTQNVQCSPVTTPILTLRLPTPTTNQTRSPSTALIVN
jgi:hypothetical protein